VPPPKFGVLTPSQGRRQGRTAKVGGRGFRNPKPKKPKSVAESERNPKIRARDRKFVSRHFCKS
jgi:hypothetical protein